MISKLWMLGLFIVPFFSISKTPHPYIYPKIILFQSLIGIGLIGLVFFRKSKSEVEIGSVQLGFFALTLFSILSLFWAGDIQAALFGPFWRGTGLVFYLSLMLGSFLLKETPSLKELMAAAFILSGTLMSLILIYSMITLKSYKAVTVLMGNANPLAYWIGTTIFINYLFRRIYPQSKRILEYLVYALCLTAVVLIGSRSSIGGIVIGFIIIAALSGKKTFKYSFIITSAIALLLIGQYFFFEDSVFSTMISKTKDFVRLGVWQGAWDSFLAKPILGYGMNGLLQGYWYNYTSSLAYGVEWNDSAHSVIFNTLAELGIIGFSLLMGIFYLIFKVILKKERLERNAWLGLLFFTVSYGFFQPYYIDPSILTLFLVFLLGDQTIITIKNHHPAYIGIKVILGFSLLFISYTQYTQVALYNQVRLNIVNNQNFRKPWDQYMKRTSYVDRAGVLRQLNTQMKAVLAQKLPRFERYKTQFPIFMTTEYPKVIKEQPNRPRALENYADWLSRKNDHAEALLVIDKILEGADNIPRAYKIKAEIYEEMKNYPKAKEMLLKAKEINPNYEVLDEHLIFIERLIKKKG